MPTTAWYALQSALFGSTDRALYSPTDFTRARDRLRRLWQWLDGDPLTEITVMHRDALNRSTVLLRPGKTTRNPPTNGEGEGEE